VLWLVVLVEADLVWQVLRAGVTHLLCLLLRAGVVQREALELLELLQLLLRVLRFRV